MFPDRSGSVRIGRLTAETAAIHTRGVALDEILLGDDVIGGMWPGKPLSCAR
jgi:hypothetical protein